jgi:transcriptional regulator with XRE-family HTH domain
MASRPTFKSDLKDAIAQRGLTQRELARLAGLRKETVGKAVAGRPVTTGTARAILAVLARTPLMEYSDLIVAEMKKAIRARTAFKEVADDAGDPQARE